MALFNDSMGIECWTVENLSSGGAPTFWVGLLLQLAFGATKASRLSKPELGHLEKTGAEPSRELAELRVDDLSGYEVGQVIAADVFSDGDVVDVTGSSKGKGFTGVMKRHNFKGQGASHGNHKKHRAPGAIGACATPARVFKGVRMAGQHGAQKVTTLNLEVVQADPERGVVWEETIIFCPAQARLLLLSASIGNPQDIAAWLSSIRPTPCHLVRHNRRTVPLRAGYLHPSGKLVPLFRSAGIPHHASLHPEVRRLISQYEDETLQPRSR